MSSPSRQILGLVVILSALNLAACGDDDSASDQDTAVMEMTAPDAAETAAASPIATPAADLRVTLDRLLGEHANLAVIAMQKGYDGDPDFEAASAALEENTVALGEAIGSVYGEEAETAFLDLWRDHIGFFVDYTVATAEGDEAARQEALDSLDGYRQAFGEFLSGANPNIEADAIAGGLQMHVGQLTGALDTYADGQYAMAYAQVREAYGHMFGTGDTLASAIVAQMPESFSG